MSSVIFRHNASLAGLLGLVAAVTQSIWILFQNQRSPFTYPNLALLMTARTLLMTFIVAQILGLALSLLFGWSQKKKLDFARLVLSELAVLAVGVGILMLIKKYLTDLIVGRWIYLAFYVSHWTKENYPVVVIFILASVWFILLERNKKGSLKKFLSRRWFFAGLGLTLLANSASWAMDQKLQSGLKKANSPNVILLSIDTLRADHLSFDGYARATSPYLDEVARESVVFKNAITAFTKTNQSFAALLTGKYSYETGMAKAAAAFLPRKNLLLSEVLKNKGYRTGALISNANLSRYFNFHDGFDDYIELWHRQKGPARERGWYAADRVTQEGVKWLQKNAHKKFFLWIHYIDPHSLYTPPLPYSEFFTKDKHANQFDEIPIGKIKETSRLGENRDPDYYHAQYDGEIHFTDDQIKIFLEELKKLGLERNTILVITADHGESLGEHDFYYDHGKFAYDTCARVPLILRYPEKISQPQTIQEVVSLVDIYPTVLDFLALRPAEIGQGTSLRPAFSANQWRRFEPVLIESNTQIGVRSQRFKMIQSLGAEKNPFQLYDVQMDPGEKKNLIEEGHPEKDPLKNLILQWSKKIQSKSNSLTSLEEGELHPEVREQLRSLGYLN